METIKILAAGNVDDGKSTLLGRLLLDADMLPSDIKYDLEMTGSKDKKMNLAHVTDGLKYERQNGITVDVAYKYFRSRKRRYVMIDAPGHTEYTKNMFTGASNADVMLLLIDVTTGITAQTIRHLQIANLLKIGKIFICINKMDLADYSQSAFKTLRIKLTVNHKKLCRNISGFIPVSSLNGDNVVSKSVKMKWYRGKSIYANLEAVKKNKQGPNTRIQVQMSMQGKGRIFHLCNVVNGSVKKDDVLQSVEHGQKCKVEKLYSGGRPVLKADRGEAISLVFSNKVIFERGTLLGKNAKVPRLSKHVTALISCFVPNGVSLGKKYLLVNGTKELLAQIAEINNPPKNIYAVQSMKREFVSTNDISELKLSFEKESAIDLSETDFESSRFIMVDSQTGQTLSAGYFTKTRW